MNHLPITLITALHAASPQATFVQRNALVNEQGRTVVRFQQTYRGARVFAGEAIGHLERDGRTNLVTQGVKQDIALDGSPAISGDRAIEIATQSLGQLLRKPTAELVVFPTRFTSGIVTRWNGSAQVIDREMSLLNRRPLAPYVWAYEVHTAEPGRSLAFIVDGATGALLRKWDRLQRETAVQGEGHGYFSGTVAISTARADDGTYELRSLERGTLPQPFMLDNGVTQTGLAIYYGIFDPEHGGGWLRPYAGHATNTWGNGLAFPPPVDPDTLQPELQYDAARKVSWELGAIDPVGESTAVDAYFGLSSTWDFYGQIFHRNGIDGIGTSTFGVVHDFINASVPYPFFDNAFWNPDIFGMEFGDGSYPIHDGAFIALTALDITGHELTHGVTGATAALIYDAQSGGLNEGTSDIFGKMVQAWVEGGRGATVSDFPAGDLGKWEIGKGARPAGSLRQMYQPSLDGASADGWYDGIDDVDVHYSSGPLNRFFYFLAAGASADPSSPSHSVWLPQGMTGLGNDRAARIWFKALTEHLLPDADFETARAAAIQSAQELYGQGSAEELAVRSAWAAVNVGEAPGQPPRVRIRMPVTNGPGSFLDSNAFPHGILSKVQFFPTRAKVTIHTVVENSDDKGAVFALAKPTEGMVAGRILPDGTWQTPSFPFYGQLLPVKATSHADPTQYAKGLALLVEMDVDQDGETDAIDLGNIAVAWGVISPPNPVAGISGGGSVSDWDLVYFNEGLTNAWPVQ